MTEHKPIKLTPKDMQEVLAEGKKGAKDSGRATARMHRQIDTFIENAISAKYLQDLNNVMWSQDFFNQFNEARRPRLHTITEGNKDE